MDDDGVGCGELEGVVSVEVGDASGHLSLDLDGDEGQWLVIVVNDAAADGTRRVRRRANAVGDGDEDRVG